MDYHRIRQINTRIYQIITRIYQISIDSKYSVERRGSIAGRRGEARADVGSEAMWAPW